MSTGRMAKCVLPALPCLCSLAEQAKPQLFRSPLLNCHLLCDTAHREIDLARPKSNVKTSGFLPEERPAWAPFVLCIPTRPLTTLGGDNGAAHTSGTSGGGSTIFSRRVRGGRSGFLEVGETTPIGQPPGISPVKLCQGGIRHYMIFRRLWLRLLMNDKGGDFKGSMQHFT